MGTHYDQLSLRERMEIDLWRREGLTGRAIALRLGHSAFTIRRELRRNARPTKQWSGPYDGERAHVLTARRRRWDSLHPPNRKAEQTAERLAKLLEPVPPALRKTLTLDNARSSRSTTA